MSQHAIDAYVEQVCRDDSGIVTLYEQNKKQWTFTSISTCVAGEWPSRTQDRVLTRLTYPKRIKPPP